ncbi:hypothetical protein LPJ75_004246 [Coemansia sp. RSA 2598]|nr:hypothetical protein LPJ75_004246 [Coemansia sp. RSA 2598]
MAAADGAVLAEFVPPAGLSFATITAAAFAAAAGSKSSGSRGAGRVVPGLSKGGGARRGQVSASSSTTSLESAGVLRLALSPNTPDAPSPKHGGTRLLAIGDAAGSLFLFNADARAAEPGVQVRSLQSWPRLHCRAVSAIDISAAILVSSGRDGQVFVTEPLSGETLSTLRCRAGGRSSAVNPWINAIQPTLVTMHTRTAVILAQLLAARTADGWARQTAGRLEDRLDREGSDNENDSDDQSEGNNEGDNNDDEVGDAFGPLIIDPHERAAGNPNRDEVPGYFAWNQIDPSLMQGYPTLVSQVVAGDSWLLAANGTHVQVCQAEKPPQTPMPRKGRGQRSLARPAQKIALELASEIDTIRIEDEETRALRIERHEQQRRIESEFGEGQLGLSADEQVQYAIWLSANQTHEHEHEHEPPASASSPASSAFAEEYSIQGMTEEEQLQYALQLSAEEHAL